MTEQIKQLWTFVIAFLIFIPATFGQVVPNPEPIGLALNDDPIDVEEVEPTQQYVEISIRGPFVEVKPAFAFGPVLKTLRSLTTQLDRIREDDEVIGILLKIENLGVGWAKLQEIRDKIIRLRESGKVVISYLNGGGNAEYLLACATD